ncbi:hypothetical protein BG015_003892 [Linnemannia schmuckeri]|uniref:DC-UbP/UBTD2 N-terminal domain-containing protein n=1 Tax=Linnemannia schmuckeri TaxID=64567 RepID=A0A9P5S9E2_9FUNG|nr:hypothetical protein BG015_003892 [Linnemannia schmuckeri]
MGCCSSTPVDDDSESGYGGRKILALKSHRWNAPAPPPTRTQLGREREEFWDTAPMYDGRAEVWQALRAACCDAENDADQVQAILDAARITVPSYITPELSAAASGNLYIIPLKILSNPGNLVEDSIHDNGEGGTRNSSAGSGGDAVLSPRGQQQHKDNTVAPLEQEEEAIVRIRLSNSQKEVALSIPIVPGGAPTITIGQIKARLVKGGWVRSERSFVRMLFLGRILEDKEQLEGISHFQIGDQGTVLQVLVSDP